MTEPGPLILIPSIIAALQVATGNVVRQINRELIARLNREH
jgi:hypothetical protein